MSGESWSPVVGRVTEDLIDSHKLDRESMERMVDSARRTLSRCAPPQSDGSAGHAHLVVGEIQSGKTLAFTTLMALARDNRFRLVIVLAGTKTNLLDQTITRLKDDLLAGTGALNPWRVWDSPDVSDAAEISRVLLAPSNPRARVDGSQTAVLFVLKHGQRLKNLRLALTAIGASTLAGVPTLVIDDEADQAGLNRAWDEGERSAIYGSIADLRATLPRHDFMMYTATPQAPLLVELEDELSPETVTVLESGPGYVGVSELFGDASDDYLRPIPDSEIEAAIEADSPPPSLRTAIATYLLALVIAQERRRPRPLSMLIHPAVSRHEHHRYATWAEEIRRDLIAKLEADPCDVSFAETLEEDFRAPYEDLATTVDGLAELADLAELIPPYAQQVAIREVNAGSDPIEAWGDFPGWILVGGNKLERGFTIENLAITYMPRGPGSFTVDTIQQRGRFFGYRNTYLDLCRGWFSADIADIYRANIGHEEPLRKALTLVDQSGQPLRSWRRELLLSPSLRPTRGEVVSLETTRYALTSRDGWFRQSRLFDRDAAAANAPLAQRLFDRYRGEAEPEELDRRSDRRHQTAEAPLQSLYEVLAEWEAVGEDVERMLGISLAIGQLLGAAPRAACRITFMDGVAGLDDVQARRRRQRQQSQGPAKTVQIFQGEDPGSGYPGDSAIRDDDLVRLQLHLLDLYERGSEVPWAEGVPALAVHLPGDPSSLILQD
jgi:hypothetical protein